MPRPQRNWGHQEENRLINEQLAYDRQEQQVYVDRKLPTLNADQNTLYHAVMDSVLNSHGSAFFLHSGGGVTIFLLFHNLLLLVFSRRVHVLSGMCRYDYVSLLLVVHPFHSRMFVL